MRTEGVGEAAGSELEEPLAGSRGRRLPEVDVGQLVDGPHDRGARPVRLVDGDVGEPVEDLRPAVLRHVAAHEPRPLVDEGGADVARLEVGVVEHTLEEGDVRGDAAAPELGQGALGPRDGGREVAPAAGELREHRVEVRADLRAGRDRAAVDADPAAARRAVRRDLAGVRAEALRRVLGRDAALERRAAQHDRVLAEAELGEGLPRRDAHLRLHEVDVRHLLGHGVLDLDARVHLDEDVLPGARPVGVEQELDRAGVDVADAPGERDRVGVHGVADRGIQVRRGRDLHDLLVPALHRAVALEQVHGLPRGVGEDLHLDVPGPEHRLLEEHGRVAERAVRLAHRGPERVLEVLRALDAPHAAAAAARDGLREDREADPLRLLEQQLHVGRRRRRREDRHAGRGRVLLGRDLVAGHLEHPGGGADEDDAVVGGRAREVGVLGEEPIARVDGVGAALERHADDLVDIEVRPDGVALLADEVRLVRLQPVQRVPVLVRVDGDRAGAQLDGGPERADRDLPAVGDEDLLEHGGAFRREGLRDPRV